LSFVDTGWSTRVEVMDIVSVEVMQFQKKQRSLDSSSDGLEENEA
jgi:hypothetical protein